MNQPTSHKLDHKPRIPRARIWIMGALFLIVAVGMYAGTMYRIQNHGYVGIDDDQPIAAPAERTN